MNFYTLLLLLSHENTNTGFPNQVLSLNFFCEMNKLINVFVSAVGCPVYKPPAHSWVEKENNSIRIGCYASDKTWTLVCINNIWLGIEGNCTPRET